MSSDDPSTKDPMLPPASQPERRQFRRAPLDKQVLVDDDRVPTPLKAKNVSGGGIAVDKSVELEIGAVLDVYFELPIGIAVEAKAEVVRVDDGTIAFRFVDLPQEQVLALRSFCRLSGLHRIEEPVRRED